MKEIIDLYEQGESVLQLAKKYRKAQATIRRIIGPDRLRRQPEALRAKRNYKPWQREPTAEQIEEIKTMYRAGNSIQKVSDELDVNVATIHRILKQAGIVRSMSEARKLAARKHRENMLVFSRRFRDMERQRIAELAALILDECA